MKGVSGGGKSYTVEITLTFLPAEACYVLSAMSERALAYSTEPLAHRMLVIYEAAGVQGDFSSYLVRSLLSEARVRYETVEKTPDGLRARLIEREGPDRFDRCTTTANQLHPENETRLLSLTVTDTQAHTSAVLALARRSARRPARPRALARAPAMDRERREARGDPLRESPSPKRSRRSPSVYAVISRRFSA